MNAQIKDLWIKALRSGDYPQTFLEFRQVSAIDHKTCYCAGGVLMALYEEHVEPIRDWNNMPIEVLEWAEASYTDEAEKYDMGDIVKMNDAHKSFAEIADFIEEHFESDDLGYDYQIPDNASNCTNCEKLAVLTVVTNGDGEPGGRLCYECCEESGYCASCGYFSAGTTDYDFSQMGAYCGECQRELKEDEFDDDEYFDYDY